MAPFFAKRLSCFYCGSRSTQSQTHSIREWQCSKCQAVNYLDENGEITDPPIATASFESQQPHYARPLSPQPEQKSDASIFCSRCLRNQFLLTETLASYLPPQSHPEYQAYEASYPAYRQNLEERYPQVCELCEPKVVERIRRAGYEAKVDHLRRIMDRSRVGRSVRNQRKWKWRSMLVSAGALAFWTSVAGQLVWNVVGCLTDANSIMQTEPPASLSISMMRSCLNEARRFRTISNECGMALQPYAGLALVLGVLSLWWNPMLRNKVDGRSGRISGIREYYRIQIVTLVMRFVAWTVLQDTSLTGLDLKLVPAIHILMGFVTLITTFASRATIGFDSKPLVSWSDNVEPLLPKSKGTAQGLSQNLPIPQKPASYPNGSTQRFPIANLAPARVSPDPHNLPTPPPDLVPDPDAMDWTPSRSQPSLQPTFQHMDRNLSQSEAAPSPFHGQLPPAPKPPSWQLRNPEAQSLTRSIQNKPNPFHSAPVLHPSTHLSQKPEAILKTTDMVMAPPRFFPPGDLRAETGLESLFDKAFSIAESPKTEARQPPKIVEGDAINKPLHIPKIIFLGICLALWVGSQSFALPKDTMETLVLGLTFLVAGFSLLELLMRPIAHWKTVDIFLSLAELVGCVYFALVRAGKVGDQTTFERAGIYLIAFLTGQELFGLRSMLGPTKAERRLQQPAKSEIKRPTSPPPTAQSFSNNSGDRTPTRSSTFQSEIPNNVQRSPLKTPFRRVDPPPVLHPRTNTNPNPFTQRDSVFNAPPKSEVQLPFPNSFSTVTQAQFLSSSFGSTERFMSPATSVSSVDFDASTISEPPSPLLSARHRTPGPSINALSLNDSPLPFKLDAPAPRYSLRSRKH